MVAAGTALAVSLLGVGSTAGATVSKSPPGGLTSVSCSNDPLRIGTVSDSDLRLSVTYPLTATWRNPDPVGLAFEVVATGGTVINNGGAADGGINPQDLRANRVDREVLIISFTPEDVVRFVSVTATATYRLPNGTTTTSTLTTTCTPPSA
jgi:hypothetical protein